MAQNHQPILIVDLCVLLDALYGEKYDPMLMHDSKRDVANLLHEESDTRSVREFIRRKQQQQSQQKQNKKKNRDSWER